MRATKKKTRKKNIAGKEFVISWNDFVFFAMFFYIPKLNVFLWQQFNARAGQKKHMFFW